MRSKCAGAAVLVLFQLCCSDHSPTAPTVLNTTGTWQGQFQVTHCEQNWIDGRNCAFNRSGEVRLKLTQSGTEVAGSLFLSTVPGARPFASIPVRGRMSDQALTLAGSTEGQVRDLVENWSATVSHGRSGRTIQGTFEVRNVGPGSCISFFGCVDAIVWKRAYATSPIRMLKE